MQARIKAWLSGAIVPILAVAAGIGLLGSAVLGYLYLGARDDLAVSVAQCNADKLETIADTERKTAKVLQAAFDQRLAEREAEAERIRRSLEISEEGREAAESQNATYQSVVRQLELQGEIDDIPDSFEALNVFVPRCAIDWLRMRANHQDGIGDSGDTWPADYCASTRDIDGADTFAATFSTVTYGDILIILDQTRGAVQSCNADKAAIRNFQVIE